MKTTAVIILNYNNYEDTFNCIKSIEKYNTANIKYIIIDNGSTRRNTVDKIYDFINRNFNDRCLILKDGETVSSPLPYMTFLASRTNDGYAQGNNKGLELAYRDDSIENILIINNDVLFVDDIISQMIFQLKQLPHCGLVSPILYRKNEVDVDYSCARLNENNWEILLNFLTWYKNPFGLISKMKNRRFILKNIPDFSKKTFHEIELPSGSCMLSQKSLWKKIDGFDPHTFLYYEENILFKKLKRLGMKNYLIPSCRCIHLGAGSTSKHGKGKYKMSKIKIDSTQYYIEYYGEMNLIQRLIYPIARLCIGSKLMIVKLIR